MRSKRNPWLIGIAAVTILVSLAGDTLAAPRGRGRGPGLHFGPPAHAPAHGYRNKVVYGYTLIFDSACGLYVVVGLTDCYYHEGHFYRLRGGVWEISLRADKWDAIGHDKLPAPVQLKAKSLVKPDKPGNNAAKPNGNSDGKPNAGGNSVAKPDTTASKDAKAGTQANSPAKPDTASAANSKPGPAGSGPAKPAGGETKAGAGVSNPAKSASSGTPAAKPANKSSSVSSKPKSTGRGKR